MEIRITTKQVLIVLEVLTWIIFIGLCVDAGGMLVNTILSIFFPEPDRAGNFWTGSAYLSHLYSRDMGHFIAVTVIMNIVAVLKAILFYLILKLLSERKLNLSHPFNNDIRSFIAKFSYLAVGIAFFSKFGFEYTEWLTTQGFDVASMEALKIAGGDVWIFMSLVLFVIGQIVKRGIEIQEENDLTI